MLLRKCKTTRPHFVNANFELTKTKIVFTWPCSRGHWQARYLKRPLEIFRHSAVVFENQGQPYFSCCLVVVSAAKDRLIMPCWTAYSTILALCTASHSSLLLLCLYVLLLYQREPGRYLVAHAVSVQPLACISCWRKGKIYHTNTSVVGFINSTHSCFRIVFTLMRYHEGLIATVLILRTSLAPHKIYEVSWRSNFSEI